MPTASNRGTSEDPPFFSYKASPLLCLPLSLCPNTRESATITRVLASSEYTAFACARLVGLHFLSQMEEPEERPSQLNLGEGSLSIS